MERKTTLDTIRVPGILFLKLVTFLSISLLLVGCQSDLIEPGATGKSLIDIENTSDNTLSVLSGPTIPWNNEKQTIDGFGASHAWYENHVKNHPQASDILDKLYTTSNGIGLSIHRMRISPLIHTGVNTYDWDHVQFTAYGWQAQQAKNRGVNTFWASCWTPAAWAKDNNNTEQGGFLLPAYYDDHASFLKAWADKMGSEYGIDIYGISPQNEPGPKVWESCDWSTTDFKNWIKNDVGPTFGPTYKLLAPEGTNGPETFEYFDAINADATARGYVDIISTHSYSAGAGGDLTAKYGKPAWHTEKWVGGSFGAGLNWAKEVHGLLKNGSRAVHYWWNAVTRTDGQALIELSPSSYDINTTFWTFGNYSKFIRPGYKRIGVSDDTPLGNQGPVFISAFKHPSSNKVVVVAINISANARIVTYGFDGFTCNNFDRYRTSETQNLQQLSSKSAGSSLAMDLPAKSVTTYVGTAIPGGGGGGPIANGAYKLENKQFSRRLKVSENLPNNVVHSNYNDTQASIRWTVSVSGAYLTAQNSENNRYLKRSDSSTNAVSSCCITDRSRWEFIDAGGGYYLLKNKATGEFLDADSVDNNVKCNSSDQGDDKLWKFIAL
ncbi:MAG: hypothetical protein MJA30_32405 [Cytophagales bacterium]|nr:hypothetical protein [Cytophagales bacterium]